MEAGERMTPPRSSRQPTSATPAESLERLRRHFAHADDGWFFAAIAAQVTERRLALGLSQVDLARRCGTSQSAIARLESGGRPPRIDTLLRLAEALDCDLAVELRPRGSDRPAETPTSTPVQPGRRPR
jgi:ribosome-binding protein aMBF1 (putative translation factor)